jgi:hypothetical protein
MNHTESSALAVLAALVLVTCSSPRAQILNAGEVAEVTLDGQPFASVHLSAEPRPFIHPLHGPGGVPMTRSYPMGVVEGESQDHPHHQSFWFAHGDVNGHDFWHGKGNDERMVQQGEAQLEYLESGCRLTCRYRWLVDEETLICTDERELVFGGNDQARSIDVTITLRPGEEPLVMGDTKEGTFALRLHPALRVDGEVATGRLTNSEGDSGKEAWGKRARWVDDSGLIDGHEVGVTIFDHPSNPSHPTWWHARNYGLLAANPFGVHDFEGGAAGSGSVVVPVGGSYTVRYRVLLHGAGWDRARIDDAYGAWIRE